MKKLVISMLSIIMILGGFTNLASASPVVQESYKLYDCCEHLQDEHLFLESYHDLMPVDTSSDLGIRDNVEINLFNEIDYIFIAYGEISQFGSFSDLITRNDVEINLFNEFDYIFIPFGDNDISRIQSDISVDYFDDLDEITERSWQCSLFGCNPVRDGRVSWVQTGGPNSAFCAWGFITEGAFCGRCGRFMGTFIVGEWETRHSWNASGGCNFCWWRR